MKMTQLAATLGVTLLLAGCQNFDSNALMQSGAQAFQAVTLNDQQVKNPERSVVPENGQRK